jgi:broad specificity phosphatase PhoE
MATAFYLTHPQVVIDPAVPVKQWGLSETGSARAIAASRARWASGIRRIVSSIERKAIETATIFAAPRGIAVESDAAFNENDRESTGFLPPQEFEVVADAFFARPDESVRGWERAVDAQARIVAAVDRALAGPGPGDVLFVGHGAVGTLLLCHVSGWPIRRIRDQPPGGGNYFAFDIASRRPRFGWRAADGEAA